jgi:hypothetical protein
MRMALATTVIFSHSYDMLGRTNPFKRATGGQTELASVAVDVFFVLSGYLITQSFCSSHTVLDYFWKRILRLFPAFVVAGVLSLMVFGPLPMGFSRSYWASLEPRVHAREERRIDRGQGWRARNRDQRLAA